jgi:hypothetical protein
MYIFIYMYIYIKVEMMKKKSEEAFRWLELEAIYTSLGKDFQINQSIQDILDDLNSDIITSMRNHNSLKFQKQLYGDFLQQEIDLHEITLGGLFNITIGKGEYIYICWYTYIHICIHMLLL